jgi:cytochrome o ubiquinol oxidase operon protein cyoD
MSDRDDAVQRLDTHDVGPGPQVAEEPVRDAILSCVIGFVLAVLLTVGSFYTLNTKAIWDPAIPVALAVLAVGQIGIHLVFFLHITTAPDNTNNVLALAFGVLIVALILGGSFWIMAHLDANMMPMDQLMRMQR